VRIKTATLWTAGGRVDRKPRQSAGGQIATGRRGLPQYRIGQMRKTRERKSGVKAHQQEARPSTWSRRERARL